MSEQTYRQFEGEIKLMERNTEFLYDIEIWLLNDAVNRNGWRYENVAENKDLFCGTPILCAYIGERIGDGHNFSMTTDPETGEKVPTFLDAKAERIVGSLSEKPEDIRVEERDGKTWVVGKGFLWAWYARELVDKIETYSEEGKGISISIETLVTESYEEEGVEVESKWIVLGTTILGDGVAPAVADARIHALQEITGEFEELKLRAASYIDNPDGEKKDNSEEPEGDNKPHENNITKGVNTLKALNKKQLAELAPKFDGYTVLSAGQDDNGIHVCLLSEDGATAIYTMESMSDVVVLEKVTKLNTTVQFEFGEECVLSVDTCDVIDKFVADTMNANSAKDSLQERLNAAEDTIRTMNANELKRRLNAAKAKATDTLNLFNANREEKVEAEAITKVNEAIDNGEYSECLNAEGEWIGEEKVKEAVLAACAAQVIEFDKASAAKNNTDYIWNRVGSHAPTSEIGALLSAYGIK